MIDFTLSDHDQDILDRVREQALVARQYARHYDENAHEFPPDELAEAKDHPSVIGDLMQRGEGDCGIGTLGMLIDGTEEQRRRYLPRIATGELMASFCLTEAGAGSDAASHPGPVHRGRWFDAAEVGRAVRTDDVDGAENVDVRRDASCAGGDVGVSAADGAVGVVDGHGVPLPHSPPRR